uniref:RNase III domain-containing protein n=1 Tax=viral metagenome TaxID=1070528 RepID=A0A6C0BKX9_9ZZZZ
MSIREKLKLPPSMSSWDDTLLSASFNVDLYPLGLSHQEIEFVGDIVLDVAMSIMTTERSIYDLWNYRIAFLSNYELGMMMDRLGLMQHIHYHRNHRSNKIGANVAEAIAGYMFYQFDCKTISTWFGSVSGCYNDLTMMKSPIVHIPVDITPWIETSDVESILTDEHIETIKIISTCNLNCTQNDCKMDRIILSHWPSCAEASLGLMGLGRTLVRLAITLDLMNLRTGKRKYTSMRDLSNAVSDQAIELLCSRKNSILFPEVRLTTRELYSYFGVLGLLFIINTNVSSAEDEIIPVINRVLK